VTTAHGLLGCGRTFPHRACGTRFAVAQCGVVRSLTSGARAMGKNIFHVGDLGHGLAMKLINNMLGQIATVAIAEALVFGKKAGLDPSKILRSSA
jgi:3-hydroxyisobutyrate dehydrogenase-like beta-hydroxyacid dehydrogenase